MQENSNDDHQINIDDIIALRQTVWPEMVREVVRISGDRDFSLAQLASLFVLGEMKELTIKQMAEILSRSVSATSRMLDQLVVRGWVVRREDVRDRRVKLVSLTVEGEEFLQSMAQKRVDAQLAVMANLSKEEQALVIEATKLLGKAARRHSHGYAKEQARDI